MILYPYTVTALAESDSAGTDGKNIVIGATVTALDQDNQAVTMFDDILGNGGATSKLTNNNGQVTIYMQAGVYRIRINAANDLWVTLGDGEGIGGVFNIADYGAVADNATDNKAAIDAAIADLSAAGGGCLYIPPQGVFRTSGAHDVPSNMTVKGDGYNSCLKRTADDVGAIFNFIAVTRPAIERENITFDSVRIEGVFDETGASGSGNGVITLVGFRNITIHNCMFYDIETFCLNMNQCENARVINNDFQRICRDVVGIWGTPNIIVANNSFIGGDDDCISLNQARFESTNDVMRDGLIVTGNYLRDTGSIKIQQAKNTVIANNVIKLCKGGNAIFLEGLASAQGQPDERNGNLLNVIVESNVIIDQISRNLSYKPDEGGANERVGIKIDSKLFTIREYDSGYAYNYSDTGAGDIGPITECNDIIVRNNIVRRTVEPDGVKTYSELFGFGKMFSRFKDEREDTPVGYIDANGFVDPVIVPAHLEMRCMEVRDGVVNLNISNNIFQGSSLKCIWFNKDTWASFADDAWTSIGGGVYSTPSTLPDVLPSVYDFTTLDNLESVASLALCQSTPNSFFLDATTLYLHRLDNAAPTTENTNIAINLALRNLVIKNNTLRDFQNVGVDLDDYVGSNQDVLIEGNTFDADPYNKDNFRNADGSWSSKVGVVCIEVKNQKGARIKENTFKNCAIPWSTGGGDNVNYIFERNTFVGEPSLTEDPTIFAESSKGLGLFPWRQDPNGELVYIDADPTSETYLHQKPKQLSIVVGNNPPPSGYYFKGQFIPARSTVYPGGQILLGFMRITSGNTHVLNTDWVGVYPQTVLSVASGPTWTATGNTIDSSAQSTTIRGVMQFSGFIYLISNSDRTAYRYSNYTNDSSSALVGGSAFVYDAHYEDNESRWICEDGLTIYEYSSAWAATGATITTSGTPQGLARIGNFYYTVSGTGTVTEYDSSYVATGSTFSSGASSVAGMDTDGTSLLIVEDAGDVYRCSTSGTSSMEFSSGLSATGISIDGSTAIISTSSGATEYAIS